MSDTRGALARSDRRVRTLGPDSFSAPSANPQDLRFKQSRPSGLTTGRAPLVNTRISERATPPLTSGKASRPWLRKLLAAEARAVLPRYVQRCGCDALYVWKRADPSLLTRTIRRCGSWRHEGPCARHEAAVTFARIKEAVERKCFRAKGWVFVVLTLDRHGHYSGKPFENEQQAYSKLSAMSRNFMARVRRLCKSNGWTSPASNWVSVVEAHKAGWPHVNLMFYAPELAEDLESERGLRLARGESGNGARILAGQLGDAAVETGWGVYSTAEQVTSRYKLASYFVKLAGTADATTGELAKLSQVPKNAAPHFRRLRSGRGFLPPRRKNPEFTGTLIRREYNVMRSAFGALPLLKIKDEQIAAISVRCCEIEGDRIEREAHARKLGRALGVDSSLFQPKLVEHFKLKGENFVLLEETGEHVTRGLGEPEIVAVDDDGYVSVRAAPLDVVLELERREPEQLSLKGLVRCAPH